MTTIGAASSLVYEHRECHFLRAFGKELAGGSQAHRCNFNLPCKVGISMAVCCVLLEHPHFGLRVFDHYQTVDSLEEGRQESGELESCRYVCKVFLNTETESPLFFPSLCFLLLFFP